jgi:uncharacterized protein involved in outer membrane biogenesis
MGLLVFVAILFAVLAVAWMLLLPVAVTRLVRERTGFGVEIQSLYVNPITANVALSGLVITNPPAFPKKDFIEVRALRADLRLFSLFGPRLEIDDAVVDVARVVIMTDAHGVINARAFQQGLAGPAGDHPQASAGAPRPEREFLIRRLQVRFDRLEIADYSRSRPEVREFDLHFNHTYENVTQAQQLAAPLAELSLPIAGAIDAVLPGASGQLRSLGDRFKETGRKAGETVKGFLEALEKSLKK